ncbi:hypothetical protein B0E44_13695 [Flavobacterium sp. A45]|nr:hypothetical protein B0E44_13695 [Flavobacterium sp. A45]
MCFIIVFEFNYLFFFFIAIEIDIGIAIEIILLPSIPNFGFLAPTEGINLVSLVFWNETRKFRNDGGNDVG